MVSMRDAESYAFIVDPPEERYVPEFVSIRDQGNSANFVEAPEPTVLKPLRRHQNDAGIMANLIPAQRGGGEWLAVRFAFYSASS